MKMNVGILGGTGYVGIEIVRLLSRHPNINIARIISQSFVGKAISEVYPNLKGVCDVVCTALDIDDIAQNCDVVFTALPHGASKEVIPALFEKDVKIIDMSGDYRYNDKAVYEKWYGEAHTSPELLEQSVYGLCEVHREKIKQTKLVGNPGCYTTCSILALAPAVEHGIIDNSSIIIDAKSGVTGAGRSAALDFSFCEAAETAKAYKIATHRHTSEIEQELSIFAGENLQLSFTPHLIPMKRGILATCYANFAADSLHKNVEALHNLYNEYYVNDYFVRLCDIGILPEVKNVAGSNFVDIGIAVDERLNRLVVVACIDNLIKGAAGQAVQNMNIMFGIDETVGLDSPGTYL
ncbi:MAG: N-acetyl-gamma-glutamyl-phosphate reductase [Oscillospiraceae bacterium]|nr:N-acetyl-gamma-glutamyl-phosphate reductase [Oscillospiraceae bacterium]